ncbi:Uncharacterised protein [Enterobacter cloacae]|nr:Uncharacterised protein [Enterobacter cloacae]
MWSLQLGIVLARLCKLSASLLTIQPIMSCLETLQAQ